MSHHHLVSKTTVSAPKFNCLQGQNLRRAVSLCLVAFLLVTLPLIAPAQEMKTITRSVPLVRGRAVINGSARQYTRYVYTFRANEGQGISLGITGGVTVTLLAPGSTYPLVEDETEALTDSLPKTGIYKIIVTNKREGTLSVPFKLTMSLSAPERS